MFSLNVSRVLSLHQYLYHSALFSGADSPFFVSAIISKECSRLWSTVAADWEVSPHLFHSPSVTAVQQTPSKRGNRGSKSQPGGRCPPPPSVCWAKQKENNRLPANQTTVLVEVCVKQKLSFFLFLFFFELNLFLTQCFRMSKHIL